MQKCLVLTLSSSKIEEVSQNSCVLKLADRQTDRHTDRQTNRKTDRETERQRDRETEREGERER